ncbi:MAG TPA: hypothetical protein VFN68_13770 [Acidimicrobiales bacterium]|nr:hypothetical protein [Acidimicrobiales bacterium]
MFIALCCAALATVAAWAATAFASAVSGRLSWALDAPLVGVGSGVAVLAVGAVKLFWRRRGRRLLALLVAAATAAASVAGVGVRDVSTMAAGARSGCAAGLGRCEATGRPKMPLLLHIGPVQARPVIRVMIWGVSGPERAVVERTARSAARLGQPLLRDYYGVAPAVYGGSWTVPGSPHRWLRRRHQKSLTPPDLADLVRRARAAEHWPDTADTQYWLATDLTAEQIGIGPAGCADHLRPPGVAGSMVRLPFASCSLPATRPHRVAAGCRPLAVVAPALVAPPTIQAGIETFIVHEFAETATDPAGGWTVLVAARCHGDPLLEIADVCEPDGSFISAPAWDTAAGWQPSLLQPPSTGHPARCVNPARPDPPAAGPGRIPVSAATGRGSTGPGTGRSP